VNQRGHVDDRRDRARVEELFGVAAISVGKRSEE